MTPARCAATLQEAPCPASDGETNSEHVSAERSLDAEDAMNGLLLYLGGALTICWGVAHVFPTGKVVQGFGPITRENRLILTMEWVAEAILLIFTGVLIVVMTARFGARGTATQTAAAVSAAMLLVLAGVSSGTGGRVDFIMYRLCAPIFVLSAALLLTGAFA